MTSSRSWLKKDLRQRLLFVAILLFILTAAFPRNGLSLLAIGLAFFAAAEFVR